MPAPLLLSIHGLQAEGHGAPERGAQEPGDLEIWREWDEPLQPVLERGQEAMGRGCESAAYCNPLGVDDDREVYQLEGDLVHTLFDECRGSFISCVGPAKDFRSLNFLAEYGGSLDSEARARGELLKRCVPVAGAHRLTGSAHGVSDLSSGAVGPTVDTSLDDQSSRDPSSQIQVYGGLRPLERAPGDFRPGSCLYVVIDSNISLRKPLSDH